MYPAVRYAHLFPRTARCAGDCRGSKRGGNRGPIDALGEPRRRAHLPHLRRGGAAGEQISEQSRASTERFGRRKTSPRLPPPPHVALPGMPRPAPSPRLPSLDPASSPSVLGANMLKVYLFRIRRKGAWPLVIRRRQATSDHPPSPPPPDRAVTPPLENFFFVSVSSVFLSIVAVILQTKRMYTVVSRQ